MAAGTLLTPIIEKTPPDILPNRVQAVEPHSIGRLDFNNTVTMTARDAQNMPQDLSERILVRADIPLE
jgi:hypothetical protein